MTTVATKDRVGFGNVLAAEWTKAWTVRSTMWTPMVMMVLITGFAVFVGATRSLQPDDTILGGSLTGAVTAQIAASVFGVLVVSGEFGSGTIRATFAATPRRGAVLAAKAVVVAVVMFTTALIGSVVAYQIGTEMLTGEGYASGDAFPAVLGIAVCCAAVGLLGLALGAVLRHSAAAITTMIGVLLLPSLFGPLFGDLQRWVAGASPMAALEKLTQTSDASPDTVGSLGAWPSLSLVCVYSATALVLTAWLVRRRDT
ncbi:ABC transporter permease subunit [Actinomadura alba]|uniref:ABC transporter permease subunit n=1 Tax=Actinomadura alba TaxID=406431 RepID=A0ABR7LXI5_9ACTN|nr:ABC transporter permease subunit [Actinomadura alba]MBC6469259.1 ABC transporter permease subunit [Actinomadura alba]